MASVVNGVSIAIANNALQKKLSEGEELRTRLQAELKEKMKNMEKEVENASMKAASKQCCMYTISVCLSVLWLIV
jgi:molecular chaperone GrpE (heat shock protein)